MIGESTEIEIITKPLSGVRVVTKVSWYHGAKRNLEPTTNRQVFVCRDCQSFMYGRPLNGFCMFCAKQFYS